MTVVLKIRMDDQLARAVRQRARGRGVSLSRYLGDLVRRDLRVAEEAAFWSSFADYYDEPEHVADARAEAEHNARTLADGLDPNQHAG